MQEKEFDRRRAAQVKALLALSDKPVVKVIDLIEILLQQEPSLPVIVQLGSCDLPLGYVRLDDKGRLLLGV
jgi:hypothetical protein